MSSNAGILIELILVLGGALAFGAYQLHQLKKLKQEREERERQERGEDADA